MAFSAGDRVKVTVSQPDVEAGAYGVVASVDDEQIGVQVDGRLIIIPPGHLRRATVATDYRSWLSEQLLPLGLLAPLVAAQLVFIAYVSITDGWDRETATIETMLALASFFVVMVMIFTVRLGETSTIRRSIIRMVQGTYLFGFTLLFLVLMPFLLMMQGLFGESPDPASGADAAPQAMAAQSPRALDRKPFLVTRACTISNSDDPGELDCEGGAGQWVFNFGGVAEPAFKAEVARRRSEAATPGQAAKPESRNLDVHWLRGGLVVPVYFVFIAVAGAVVGMLRRIPEIQRKSFVGINAYEAGLPNPLEGLTIGQTREHLMFQVVQAVTAPFIALLAYATVKPGSEIATTVIAFASGFSAEPFLVIIRDVSNRLSGMAADETPKAPPPDEKPPDSARSTSPD